MSWFANLFGKKAHSEPRKPRLELLQLEDRVVPSTVVGDFSTGVWRYEPSTGWQHLTTAHASLLAAGSNGEVVGEFSTGVWRYKDSTGWQHLTWYDSSQVGISSSTYYGEVVGEFQGGGVWEYNDYTGWTQLTSADASHLAFA